MKIKSGTPFSSLNGMYVCWRVDSYNNKAKICTCGKIKMMGDMPFFLSNDSLWDGYYPDEIREPKFNYGYRLRDTVHEEDDIKLLNLKEVQKCVF